MTETRNPEFRVSAIREVRVTMKKTVTILAVCVAALFAACPSRAGSGSAVSNAFGLPSGCIADSTNKPVVVLVRGAGIFAEDNPSYWTDIKQQLESEGYTVWRCDSINPKGRIEYNGRALSDFVNAQVASAGTAPETIALVAHSMGGLISRYYLSQYGATANGKKVRILVTLGTPHCGSRLTHGSTWWLPVDSEGYAQLTENYCTQDFNRKYTGTAYARTYFFAGNAGASSSWDKYRSGHKKLNSRTPCGLTNASDGAVTVRSAHGRYISESCADEKQVKASFSSGGREYLYAFGADHNQMKYDDDSGTPPAGILSTLLAVLRGAPPEPSAASYQAGSVSLADAVGAWSDVALLTGSVEQSIVKTHTVPIDPAAAAEFICRTTDADAEVTLIAPNGTHVTEDTADPSVAFSEEWSIDGRSKSFVISDPAPGVWTVQVHGRSVPVSPEDYGVAVAVQSSLALIPACSYANSTGAPVVISAKLENAGSMVPAQTVRVTLFSAPGLTAALDLLDDGLHSDGTSSDGLYANVWAEAQAGFYTVRLGASGTVGGYAFQRIEYTDIQVSDPTASLAGACTDAAVDANPDVEGIDTLRLQFGLDVSRGSNFTVTGALVKAGQIVTRAAAVRTDLALGLNAVALDFNGSEIRASGVAGPYTLADLTVFDDSADPPLIVAQHPGGYVTSVSDPLTFSDGTPPFPIVDLTVTGTGPSSVTLTWSSPVDDTAATAYEMRIGPEPVSLVTWEASTPVAGLPAPKGKNEPQTFTVTGLSAGAWYFGIRSRDAAGNWSQVSNSPMATLQASAAPATGTITPSSGSVVTGVKQSFTATFSDGDGHGDIADCRVLLNTALQGANGIFLRLDRTNNKLYLRSDNNSGWLGGHAPGSGNVIENGRCTIHCDRTTFSGNGNTLTLNISLTLKPLVAGKTLTEWLYVGDAAGHGDGWNQAGEITVASAPPSNTSVSPSSGLVPAGAQTFTTVQRDASGYTDLKCSYLLINDVVSGLGAVYAWYDATTNKLWLRSDDNNAWLGGYAPGSANTLENSRAKLLCSGTTVTGSGPDLTINWAIETKPAMQARKCGIWLYAVDMGGANTGFEKKGEVTFDRAPVNTSLSPSASNSLSAGTKTVLTATYIDPDGHADIRNTYLVLNTALSSFRGISLSYDAAANKLYLRNDLNTAWLGGVAPGSPGGVIENSYCRVDCAATAVERDGNNLRVNWSIEPKSPMVGKTLKAWMYVIDAAGAADGWDEMASYLIGAGGLNVSVSPINTSVMAGFPVTLTTRSGAPNGKAATSTYLLMNTSLNPGGAIYLFYDGPSNKLYLRNDAGSAWLGGHAPGSANTISNNLVTVNCANSTAAMVGDQLEVRWSVQFSQTAVGRTFNVWMYTLDNTGLTDGWDAMGALAAAP